MKLVIIESNAGDHTQKLTTKSVLIFHPWDWFGVLSNTINLVTQKKKEKRIFLSPSFLICLINFSLQHFQLSSNPLDIKSEGVTRY